MAIRVAQARSTALEASGLPDEAAAELAPYTQDQLDEAAGDVEPDEEFVAFDLSEFDAEGEYDDDYPVEASGDAGTSERAEAELDEADDQDESEDDEALAEAEALLADDSSADDTTADADEPASGDQSEGDR